MSYLAYFLIFVLRFSKRKISSSPSSEALTISGLSIENLSGLYQSFPS